MATDPFRYFRVEARELVDGLSQGILELERGASDPPLVARLLRISHTLKGAARVVKQQNIAAAAHQIEEVLAPLREGGHQAAPGQIEALISLLDSIEEGLGTLDQNRPIAAEAEITTLAAAAIVPKTVRNPASTTAEDQFHTVRIDVTEMDQLLAALTSTGAQLAAIKKQVAELQGLAGVAYSLTSRLLLSSKGSQNAGGETEHELSQKLHSEIERAGERLFVGVARLEHELSQAQTGADRLRLIPVQTLSAPLARAVRDAARAVGKDVDFELEGGDVRLDSKVLTPLKDALGHAVRNAVAHGIESPQVRRELGKSPRGAIRLSISSRGKFVVCECSDDGSGIDEAAVRRGMIQGGSLQPDEQITREQLFERLLSGGLSTSREVTQISGRGIGLDAIRETALRIEGQVSLDSQPGRGTRVSFQVPISLVSLPALILETNGTAVAVPLEAVVEARRFTQQEIQRAPTGASVDIFGKSIPFLPLSYVLRFDDGPTRPALSSVILQSGGQMAAFGVDALRGTTSLVVRPLPPGLAAEPTVAGISLDAAGRPRLVLDPAALIGATISEWLGDSRGRSRSDPVLVIDDSLTTRMLEQSILESAGYVVEVATSGEQGLEKALSKKYSIFLVDVDMPGMNGFEFVEKTRADPELSKTPAILVTSRNSPEDVARGRRVGAGDYIEKGEFDQNRLLQSIERLVSR